VFWMLTVTMFPWFRGPILGGFSSYFVTMTNHHASVVSFPRCIGRAPLLVWALKIANLLLLNQELWGEIGQDEMERDRMILQLEEDCLNVYRTKVDQTRKQKADLRQDLSFGEADIKKILSALGECDTFSMVSFSFIFRSMDVFIIVLFSNLSFVLTFAVREAWWHIDGTTCQDRASAERFETEEGSTNR
jgi:hypothetical protein